MGLLSPTGSLLLAKKLVSASPPPSPFSRVADRAASGNIGCKIPQKFPELETKTGNPKYLAGDQFFTSLVSCFGFGFGFGFIDLHRSPAALGGWHAAHAVKTVDLQGELSNGPLAPALDALLLRLREGLGSDVLEIHGFHGRPFR